MSLGTIRLQPNMSYDQLVNAINQNNALLENLNVSQTFKDETGKARIILGKFPDGTYGLIVSSPGVDVNSLFQT